MSPSPYKAVYFHPYEVDMMPGALLRHTHTCGSSLIPKPTTCSHHLLGSSLTDHVDNIQLAQKSESMMMVVLWCKSNLPLYMVL